MFMLRRWIVTLTLLALAGGLVAAQTLDRSQRAEIRFLQGMIDHHQMALDMALDCLERASTDEVRTICEAVIAAQTPEIEQMQAWLLEWYNIAYAPMSMAAAHTSTAGIADGDALHCAMMGEEAMRCEGNMMSGQEAMRCEMMDQGAMRCEMMGQSGRMGQGAMRCEMTADGGMRCEGGMMDQQGMRCEMMGQGEMNCGSMGEGGMMGMMGGMMGRGAAQPTADPHAGHSGHGAAQPTADPHAGHSDTSDHLNQPFTDPPMMMGMMAGFNRYTGLDYDIAWLESMIDHHDDALHMAERILGRVVHAELGTLAQAIISDQSAEIELMETLISTLEAQR